MTRAEERLFAARLWHAAQPADVPRLPWELAGEDLTVGLADGHTARIVCTPLGYRVEISESGLVFAHGSSLRLAEALDQVQDFVQNLNLSLRQGA